MQKAVITASFLSKVLGTDINVIQSENHLYLIREEGKPDKPVTLTRTYKAAYNRERVFTGEYATECAINGTPCTVKAFDQWIATNVCQQDIYKLLTTVRYFTEGIQSKA